ncbi:MAG: ISL3 family transposase [Fimbriimonadaceae bacterium]|nr:ISL3 family transposase [Fimbriimonadaceae bacterium]
MQRLRANLGDLPPFVGAYEHISRQLQRYVVNLSRMMTILDVAELTGLGWDTVKGIIKKRLAKDYAHIRLKDLRRLAIDEIYLGRKKKFVTLVIDQETGRIVWVGRGRAGDALHGFWRRLKASGAKIEAVAMDMSQAYAAAVARHLPNALIVFDRFHVMKLMNEKLDDLRRELVRDAQSQDAKVAIKGTRWLLLYRRDNLPKNKARALEDALKLNRPLATAYMLKEELALAWEQGSWEEMADFCSSWCEKAILSGIDQLMAMSESLTNHAEGILSYTVTRMTNGRMEGINRKIKTMLRVFYGLRDDDFLRLKLYALHESKHKLVG